MSRRIRANDPAYVSEQYATAVGLAARKAAHRNATGVDARGVAVAAVLEVGPVDVLEVGCGEGELAARIGSSPGVRLVATDQSPRMVELTRDRGTDARIADVQDLPFADDAFDVVLAAWMLYHAPDIPRALSEIVRVLRPGGRLVAVTNADDHLIELFELADAGHAELAFSAETAASFLGEAFVSVERRDAPGEVVFPDIESVVAYYRSSARLDEFVDRLPLELSEPLVARRRPVVFVATKDAA